MKPAIAIGVAAVLWFFIFSPWTRGYVNFWWAMSGAAIVLTVLTVSLTPDRKALFQIEKPVKQLLGGVGIAVALWGVFWLGDRLSTMMFDFAQGQVEAVYAIRNGLPAGQIALLLLLLIGPAEELFWRGYVQRTLTRILSGKRAADLAFVVTALFYALIHIWSMNFMLVMAALVAGTVWGFLYRLNPKLLPALVVSHALWDAMVFVIIPI